MDPSDLAAGPGRQAASSRAYRTACFAPEAQARPALQQFWELRQRDEVDRSSPSSSLRFLASRAAAPSVRIDACHILGRVLDREAVLELLQLAGSAEVAVAQAARSQLGGAILNLRGAPDRERPCADDEILVKVALTAAAGRANRKNAITILRLAADEPCPVRRQQVYDSLGAIARDSQGHTAHLACDALRTQATRHDPFKVPSLLFGLAFASDPSIRQRAAAPT